MLEHSGARAWQYMYANNGPACKPGGGGPSGEIMRAHLKWSLYSGRFSHGQSASEAHSAGAAFMRALTARLRSLTLAEHANACVLFARASRYARTLACWARVASVCKAPLGGPLASVPPASRQRRTESPALVPPCTGTVLLPSREPETKVAQAHRFTTSLAQKNTTSSACQPHSQPAGQPGILPGSSLSSNFSLAGWAH